MKRCIQILIVIVLLIPGTGAARGEEAELIPEKTLRAGLVPSFGFQVQEWDGGGKNLMLFSTGLGLEYGVRNWINAVVLWSPGVNLWSDMEGIPDIGGVGYFTDLYLGARVGIIGRESLLRREDMRLSAALGIKAPLPSAGEDRLEDDLHLWGSSVRVWYDYIFTPLFYLNGYVEGIYYPDQETDNPDFRSRTVYHPLDITMELDGRFRYTLEGKGVTLHWGLPLTCRMSPWINRREAATGMESLYWFSVGVFFMASFDRMACPFDLFLRYEAPVAGKNDRPVHRASLGGRVSFNFGQ